MTGSAGRTASRQDYLGRAGTLIVLRPMPGRDAAGPDRAELQDAELQDTKLQDTKLQDTKLQDAELQDAELFLVLADDGSITAFNGHVDLGTGVRTALAQIVAEELDVPIARVTMVLGDTQTAPDQGPTIASETIQVSAIPLRQAAAQARCFLLELAARTLDRDIAELRTADGCVLAGAAGSIMTVSFETLLTGRRDRIVLSAKAPVKAVADYRVVGRSIQRVDIPAKATGQPVYVQDVRLPSMLHGRVVRPPYAGLDSGDFVGTSLLSVDEASLAGLDGIVAVVVIRDFVGVVAEREEQAAAAAQRLRVEWKPGPVTPDLNDLRAALRAQPSRPRVLLDTGMVDRRLDDARIRMPRTYVWPYQLHASIGPSCAVADYSDDAVRIWSGTQNPIPLRADLALLLDLPDSRIEIIRLETSGCYGRNCADDVAADAVLLSRAVRRPVKVQLTREQENLWEPKGAAQVMQVDGGLAADGSVAAYDLSTCYPSNAAPTLALLLTGAVPPVAVVSEMGDRTAIPPYRFEHARVVVQDMAPIVRASWLRGVSALPNSFAHECYIDELAAEAGVDPIEFRLRHLDDERAVDLINAVAQRAGWQARSGARRQERGAHLRHGQGFAYARYLHGKFPGTAAAWSAWVAEVEVDMDSGEVHVARVVVGQDTGLVINPAGVQHQLHGNVIQSISRTLKEEVRYDGLTPTSREWGAYPILRFPEVPVIQVVMMPRPQEPPLGAGESASVPSAAAIANAIFDATGVRLREPPFTPERVRAALHADGVPRGQRGHHEQHEQHEQHRQHGHHEQHEQHGQHGQLSQPATADTSAPPASAPGAAALRLEALRELGLPPQETPRGPWRRRLAIGVTSAVGLAVAWMVWPAPIAATAAPEPLLYSAHAIEHGRQLAALGACAECHTAPGRAENAGGRPLETPFGTVYSTNITPDPGTGIGGWSYAAFERAMRSGVHRDGRQLYPAFPYTAFALTADADLQALYAYLMSRPPVHSDVPPTRLSFPFNLRPLMKFWNALFLRPGAFVPNPSRTTAWNRGAYLVEGLGHCSACHSPRNVLGAEQGGARHFAGGSADGWEAPALTALNAAPIAWSEAELFNYLKTGSSRFHGAAAGPMQPVVANLAQLPDADVRAMAHYLASFSSQIPMLAEQEMAQILTNRAETGAVPHVERTHPAGARLFEGACASCHESDAVSSPALPSLALHTNLHSANPGNLVRAVLDGLNVPALGHFGAMPAFRASLDDRQIADLAGYLRARFAGDKPAWDRAAVTEAAARLRRGSPPG